MAGMNRTRMTRLFFWEWWRRMQDEGIRFFRHKENGALMEALDAKWNGATGMVYLGKVFDERRYPVHRYRVCYTKLEPLNDMEVIAHCAASESD